MSKLNNIFIYIHHLVGSTEDIFQLAFIVDEGMHRPGIGFWSSVVDAVLHLGGDSKVVACASNGPEEIWIRSLGHCNNCAIG